VKCLKIGLGDFEVAFSTLLQNPLPESNQIYSVYRVREVAVLADRQLLVSFCDKFAVYAVLILFVNTQMTIRAGRGDIIRMNRGFRIRHRQLTVGSMAVNTGGCDHQPTL